MYIVIANKKTSFKLKKNYIMKKNFGELMPNFGLAHKEGVQLSSENNVPSGTKGGFTRMCVVVSLFLVLLLPLMPLPAWGQSQTSAPASRSQKQAPSCVAVNASQGKGDGFSSLTSHGSSLHPRRWSLEKCLKRMLGKPSFMEARSSFRRTFSKLRKEGPAALRRDISAPNKSSFHLTEAEFEKCRRWLLGEATLRKNRSSARMTPSKLKKRNPVASNKLYRSKARQVEAQENEYPLDMWEVPSAPRIAITPSGVKVVADDILQLAFGDTMQLVVYAAETGKPVYQTLMWEDPSFRGSVPRIVADCPKDSFSDGTLYLFGVYMLDYGMPYQVAGSARRVSFAKEKPDSFSEDGEDIAPYKEIILQILPVGERLKMIFKIAGQPGLKKCLYVSVYDPTSGYFEDYPLGLDRVEGDFAVYTCGEIDAKVFYPVHDRMFRVYIRDMMDPKAPAKQLTNFRTDLGEFLEKDSSEFGTDLGESLFGEVREAGFGDRGKTADVVKD